MRPISAPLIRSRLWRFINLFTYLLTYLLIFRACLACLNIRKYAFEMLTFHRDSKIYSDTYCLFRHPVKAASTPGKHVAWQHVSRTSNLYPDTYMEIISAFIVINADCCYQALSKSHYSLYQKRSVALKYAKMRWRPGLDLSYSRSLEGKGTPPPPHHRRLDPRAFGGSALATYPYGSFSEILAHGPTRICRRPTPLA